MCGIVGYIGKIKAYNFLSEITSPQLLLTTYFGDLRDNYTANGPEKSGLYKNGNTKSIKLVKNKKPMLIIGNNNGNSEIFELNIAK